MPAIDSAWQWRELGEWVLLVVPRLLCLLHVRRSETHPVDCGLPDAEWMRLRLLQHARRTVCKRQRGGMREFCVSGWQLSLITTQGPPPNGQQAGGMVMQPCMVWPILLARGTNSRLLALVLVCFTSMALFHARAPQNGSGSGCCSTRKGQVAQGSAAASVSAHVLTVCKA